MMITPYGVRPTLKRILSTPKTRKGYIEIGIPNKGYDLNEEEL